MLGKTQTSADENHQPFERIEPIEPFEPIFSAQLFCNKPE